MRSAWACLAFLLVGSFAWAGDRAGRLAYQVAPVIESGALSALAVTLSLEGDADGQTELALPTSGLPAGARASYLQDLTVEGARVDAERFDRLVIAHAPKARLTVRYRLTSGYDRLPSAQPLRPLLLTDWFAVHGGAAFVAPTGRDRAAATLAWTSLPAGWTAASNLDRRTTVATLGDAILIGGTGWRVVKAGPAVLHVREEGWRVSPVEAAGLMARVFEADFAYWGDAPRPLFVPVLRLDGGDFGGRGLANGMLLLGGRDIDLREHRRLFAHEHVHGWISRQVGGFPLIEDNLSAWFNEGVTEALATRSLLRGGLWTLEDYVADLNESLKRYGLSPEAEASNQRIQDLRGSDVDVGRLPYDRGRLLATAWDRRLRAATGGRVGLDLVLRTQRRLAAANDRAGRHVPANELFPLAVKAAGGPDLGEDIAGYVDAGRRIELPADLFGDCGRIESVEQPIFERGFDLKATFGAGRKIVGLTPGGPAARAGLRDGDRIRIDELPSRDSQAPLTYRVVEPGKPDRAVTYRPEGEGTVRFQRFALRPGMSEADRARCARMLNGLI